MGRANHWTGLTLEFGSEDGNGAYLLRIQLLQGPAGEQQIAKLLERLGPENVGLRIWLFHYLWGKAHASLCFIVCKRGGRVHGDRARCLAAAFTGKSHVISIWVHAAGAQQGWQQSLSHLPVQTIHYRCSTVSTVSWCLLSPRRWKEGNTLPSPLSVPQAGSLLFLHLLLSLCAAEECSL